MAGGSRPSLAFCGWGLAHLSLNVGGWSRPLLAFCGWGLARLSLTVGGWSRPPLAYCGGGVSPPSRLGWGGIFNPFGGGYLTRGPCHWVGETCPGPSPRPLQAHHTVFDVVSQLVQVADKTNDQTIGGLLCQLMRLVFCLPVKHLKSGFFCRIKLT